MRNKLLERAVHIVKTGWHQGARLVHGLPMTEELRYALIKSHCHVSYACQSADVIKHGKKTNTIQMDGRATKTRNAQKGAGISSQAV